MNVICELINHLNSQMNNDDHKYIDEIDWKLREEDELLKVTTDFLIPTLNTCIFRKPTPKLRSLFECVNGWTNGHTLLLSLKKMDGILLDKSILATFSAHRDHWDDSAPMLYPNEKLSIIGSIGPPLTEDLLYLVWHDSCDKEPEVWKYFGQSFSRYLDIEDYLKYWLDMANEISLDDMDFPLPK